MKKKTPSRTLWKARCMAAEVCSEAMRDEIHQRATALTDCRKKCTELQRDYDDKNKRVEDLYQELAKRPTVKEFVEVRVLPFWIGALVIAMLGMEIGFGYAMWDRYHELSQPIFTPYPVVITKSTGVNLDTYNAVAAKLDDCQDEWRDLKRRLRRRGVDRDANGL